jgi:hypothetical protein
MTLYEDAFYVPAKLTVLSEKDAVFSLREAWLSIFGTYPSLLCLSVLAAQSALETKHWTEINNFNFGNLKRKIGNKFTMFATGENIYDPKTKKTIWTWFEPPHLQTAFRSYDVPTDGAKDYISFLQNRNCSEQWRNKAYKKAFGFLMAGDPEKFSFALHDAGYYNAPPEKYTVGVLCLFAEFKKKIPVWEKEFKMEEDKRDTDPSPPPTSTGSDTDPAPPPFEEIKDPDIFPKDLGAVPVNATKLNKLGTNPVKNTGSVIFVVIAGLIGVVSAILQSCV